MDPMSGDRQRGSRFHWRGLTSFLVTWGFLILTATGVVLYIAPPGRVAHWTDWRVAGLNKEQWSAVHMVSGILFVVSAGVHLAFNWRVFWHYIRARGRLHLKREMVASLFIAVVLVVGTLLESAPFRYVTEVSDRARAYWDGRSDPAPYPHAETSTLAEFAQQTQIPVETLQARLKDLGADANDPTQTWGSVAAQLGLTPAELTEKAQVRVPAARGGAGSGGGSGMGRQTLRQACLAQGSDVHLVIKTLEARGWNVSQDEAIRTIAERTGLRPMEILEIIRTTSKSQEEADPSP